MSPPPQLATLTMIDHLPCPIPGCNHFTHWPQPTFLLQIYLTTSLQPRQPPCHLLPCRPINLHCCCGHLLFPALPHQHASSTPSASSHNTMSSTTHHHQYIHPLPPTSHHQYPSTLSTLEHSSSTQTVRMGLTTCGISASLLSYTTLIITHPTSKTHGAVTSNNATAQTFSAYKPTPFKPSINSTPFWWLIFHLVMLVLSPSTTTKCSHKYD